MRVLAGGAMVTAIVVAAGCVRPAPPAPPKKPLDVSVVEPIIRMVTKTEYFTGHTEAFKYVEIKPQVTGELKKVNFEDGDVVRNGTVLFEIDKRLYDAQQKTAVASLAKAKANLAQALADLERAVAARQKGVGSQADLDAAQASKEAAEASIEAAKANIELANLNLTWCEITAPYSGRLSMRKIDPGNIVNANTTVLTTIIVLDPIYIGFDIDERTVQRRRAAINAGEIPGALPSQRRSVLEVDVGFGYQEGFPLRAKVVFSDNQFDIGTGTLHIRAEMQNPLLRPGLSALTGMAAMQDPGIKELRLISPNMFVRVQLPLGQPYEALLVPEEAIVSDQGHKNVFVVNKSTNKVEYRQVKLGPTRLPDDPADTRVFRSIEERTADSPPNTGVARGEFVVVGGQQRLREGDVVNPKVGK